MTPFLRKCQISTDKGLLQTYPLLHWQGFDAKLSERLMLNCTASPATESRSNPVSDRCLPKTGIFQISAGDYRRFRSHSGQFRSPETDSQFAKARHWRAFLRSLRVKSPGVGLPGWRRSADRTRLHENSLLTGNFTGKFAILVAQRLILRSENAAPQRLLA